MYIDALTGAIAELVLLLIAIITLIDARKNKVVTVAVVGTYFLLATFIFSLAAPNLGVAMDTASWAFAR